MNRATSGNNVEDEELTANGIHLSPRNQTLHYIANYMSGQKIDSALPVEERIKDSNIQAESIPTNVLSKSIFESFIPSIQLIVFVTVINN